MCLAARDVFTALQTVKVLFSREDSSAPKAPTSVLFWLCSGHDGNGDLEGKRDFSGMAPMSNRVKKDGPGREVPARACHAIGASETGISLGPPRRTSQSAVADRRFSRRWPFIRIRRPKSTLGSAAADLEKSAAELPCGFDCETHQPRQSRKKPLSWVAGAAPPPKLSAPLRCLSVR